MAIMTHSASAFALVPTAPLIRRAMDAVWLGRSIRSQLLLLFILIDLMAALIAGSVIIARARIQTRVETAASMRLAELLVGDAVRLMHRQVPAEQFLKVLPAQLQAMRHVRFTVSDAAGTPIAAAPAGGGGTAAHHPAPNWFVWLVAPVTDSRIVPVLAEGRTVGYVEIIGEPGDEIAEVWDNAVVLGIVALLINGAMIAILYVLFGRVLNPLTTLASGLSDLERQTYSVRLPPPRARELAALAGHFNALALALETVRAENLRLNRRLITAQDHERRRTALELHDEVGPCLFGLKANASSIAHAAERLPEQAQQAMADRLRDILAIIGHLQTINRSMLERLRPMALGHVPLNEMIGQLVSERAREHPGTAFTFAGDGLARSYGDSIDLTIYRCIQESLTNAIRHAEAKHIRVELRPDNVRASLELSVQDDGCGIDPVKPAGFGTRGMRERVEGLGGHYAVESSPSRGTCVRITVPLAEAREAVEVAHGRGAPA
jgi:two-component system sensor histidine kinase UhpB